MRAGGGGAARRGPLWKRSREKEEDSWVKGGKGEEGHVPKALPLLHGSLSHQRAWPSIPSEEAEEPAAASYKK